MGIIKKQGIQGTIFLYIGVFIGFVTSSILFPRILSEEQIGLVNTLLAYSIVFAQFSTLGFNSVMTRMFSYFRSYENKHNNFFFFVFGIIIIGSLVAIISLYLSKNFIISQNIKNSPLFVEYINYLVPLIVFSLIFYILDNYYTVLFKTVRGIFLKEFVQKVLILVALIFYYIELVNLKGFVIGYIIALSLPAVVLIITLIVEKEIVLWPKLSYVSKDLAKSMLNVGLFGILTSIVGSANIQIDKAMTSSMLGLKATGIYSTVFIFAAFIKIPSRALLKIASAVIAEAWKRNDLEQIKKVYKETSINQYIIGLLVFVGLWANVDNIFRILPEGYDAGKYVILFLGIAYTFEMATGAANNIIATSKYYRYLTWFVAAMLVLVVVSNFIFIPFFKITGVALATSLTVVIFTLIKLVFIFKKFKMQPFNIKFLYISLVGVFTYLLSNIVPVFNSLIVDILVRSGAIIFIFTLFLYILKVSSGINSIVKIFWKRISKTIR